MDIKVNVSYEEVKAAVEALVSARVHADGLVVHMIDLTGYSGATVTLREPEKADTSEVATFVSTLLELKE